MFGIFEPQPQVNGTPNPELKSQWDGWLSDPKNRAGLMGFGLQAMAGGWGNGTQQLSAALGAGVDSYSGMAELEQAEALRVAKEGRADANREDNQAHDIELQGMRDKAAMDRTKAVTERGQNTTLNRYEQMLYNRIYTQTEKVLREGNLINGIDPLEDETEIAVRAGNAAQEAVERQRTTFGKGGEKTTPNGAGAANGGPAVQSAPAEKRPPRGNVGADPKGAQAAPPTVDWKKRQTQLEGILNNPDKLKEFEKRHGQGSAQQLYLEAVKKQSWIGRAW